MKRRAVLFLVALAGTLLGAAAVFGQQTAALSAPEQQAMSDTVQHALENNKTNQPSDWVNPDTGNSGGVTPVRTFANADGQPCREFISTIIIGGEQQQGYGTACRQPDGTWQIVSDQAANAQVPPPAQTNIYVDNPPPQYYYYPNDFYYPYHIYLSFGYIYRSGYVFRGSYFLDGRAFRHRYPIRVRERVFITPRDRPHYDRFRTWWGYRDRERIYRHYEQRQERWEQRQRRDWRDRDRGDRPWRRRDR